MTHRLLAIVKREIHSFFAEPIMAVLLLAFLSVSMALPLYFGGILSRDQADLAPMFDFFPWILLILTPAVGMRSWAEEFKSGTIELIMTWPVPAAYWVVGKFLAAWAVIAALIMLTMPMALAVSYLGDPDWGMICTGYLASILLAGGFLSIAQFASAMHKNQVAAFVLGIAMCFMFAMSGSELIAGFVGSYIGYFADILLMIGTKTHFDKMIDGAVSMSGLGFFLSLMGLFLYLTNCAVLSRTGR